ncbi:MAG: hypothetical protein U1E46_07050 [Hyphomicrobiales bacterium]
MTNRIEPLVLALWLTAIAGAIALGVAEDGAGSRQAAAVLVPR